MNRHFNALAVCEVYKPHARGDEPDVVAHDNVSANINPTHVGMNRHRGHIFGGTKNKPHARGDEPSKRLDRIPYDP